jgi:hypothetical protein
MWGWLGIALVFAGILAGGAWAWALEVPGLAILAFALFKGVGTGLFQTAAGAGVSAAAPLLMTIATGAFAGVATIGRNSIGV